MQTKEPVYFPVVRLKEGERNALIGLPKPVAERIEPRFVLPPPKERDTETGRVLSQDEFIHFSGKRIGQYWPMRVCYVECRYLFKEYGHENAEAWLPRLFEVARYNNGLPVPLASLDEAVGSGATALRQALPDNLNKKFGLRICFGDLGDDNLKFRITAALTAMGVSSRQTVVFFDFADADLSEPTTIADFLSGALQTLQELGVWARIVFQGTNYPEKNPATPGGMVKVSRTEWQAWSHLVVNDPDAMQQLAYGDYMADSAKFVFKNGGAVPIRHFRYCGDQDWYVPRGQADAPQGDAMKSVASMILKSGAFMGRQFSKGDDRIYQIANGISGGGNATVWREINTSHHITKVVHDLGKLYGFSIEPIKVEEEPSQKDLFLVE
jgi:hypothetical protein